MENKTSKSHSHDGQILKNNPDEYIVSLKSYSSVKIKSFLQSHAYS